MIRISCDHGLQELYTLLDTMYCMERNISMENQGYIGSYCPDVCLEYEGAEIHVVPHKGDFIPSWGGCHEVILRYSNNPREVLLVSPTSKLCDVIKQYKVKR